MAIVAGLLYPIAETAGIRQTERNRLVTRYDPLRQLRRK